MKANVIKLDAKSAGSIDLDDAIFGYISSWLNKKSLNAS